MGEREVEGKRVREGASAVVLVFLESLLLSFSFHRLMCVFFRGLCFCEDVHWEMSKDHFPVPLFFLRSPMMLPIWGMELFLSLEV
jgi:hypothetical protein